MGLFLMFLARDAYLSVFSVSPKLHSAGEQAAIITVRELPPRESYRILVSLESLYGTWPFLDASVSEAITFPKASNPLLMLTPSLN